MATWPAQGAHPWRDGLKAYIDDVAGAADVTEAVAEALADDPDIRDTLLEQIDFSAIESSIVVSVVVHTGNETRPANKNVVFWVDNRVDQTLPPVFMGSSDVWITSQGLGAGGAAADTDPPSIPTGLVASSVGGNSFVLKWAASTDNIGVNSYEVFIDGSSVGPTAIRSMTITGLDSETTYSATVRARDIAGNWSEQSSALSVETAGDGVVGGVFSVWNNDTPPGTWSLQTGSTPYIETGMSFYKYNSSAPAGLPNARVVGARLWLPSGIVSGLPTEATFRAYPPGSVLGDTPAQTKVVDISDVTAGSWAEAMFDSPQLIEDDSDYWLISVQLTGPDDAGKYVVGADARVEAANNFVRSEMDVNLVWAEYSTGSIVYKQGTSAAASAANGPSYGIDILVDTF